MGQKYFYTYNMPNQIKALQHDDLGLADSLCHYTTGKEIPGHKYISREWKNGGWVYTYADKDAPVNRRENREGQAANADSIAKSQNRRNKREIKEKWFLKDETAFNKEKDKIADELSKIMDYYEKEAADTYNFNQSELTTKWNRNNKYGTNYSRMHFDEAKKLKQELNNLSAKDYAEFKSKVETLTNEYRVHKYLSTHTHEENLQLLGNIK